MSSDHCRRLAAFKDFITSIGCGKAARQLTVDSPTGQAGRAEQGAMRAPTLLSRRSLHTSGGSTRATAAKRPPYTDSLQHDDIVARVPELLGRHVLHVVVEPFGVLGEQLLNDGVSMVQRASLPFRSDERIVIVDEVALRDVFQHNVVAASSGVSRATYKWLGILGDRTLPDDVQASLKQPGDAKYHEYGQCLHVIHSAGLERPTRPLTWDEAVDKLSDVYRNVFVAFASCSQQTLRLRPLSCGIFSSDSKDKKYVLTATAFCTGLKKLDSVMSLKLSARKVSLCIFEESELDSFEEAIHGMSRVRHTPSTIAEEVDAVAARVGAGPMPGKTSL